MMKKTWFTLNIFKFLTWNNQAWYFLCTVKLVIGIFVYIFALGGLYCWYLFHEFEAFKFIIHKYWYIILFTKLRSFFSTQICTVYVVFYFFTCLFNIPMYILKRIILWDIEQKKVLKLLLYYVVFWFGNLFLILIPIYLLYILLLILAEYWFRNKYREKILPSVVNWIFCHGFWYPSKFV